MEDEQGKAREQRAVESHAVRASRLNRSEVEAAVVRWARMLELDYRVEDTQQTWLRRDFTVSIWGSPKAADQFADWLKSLREGAGDSGG